MKLRIHDQLIDIRAAADALQLDGEPVPVTLVRQRRLGETTELLIRLGDRPVRLYATPQPDGSLAIQAPGGLRALAHPAGAAAPVRSAHGPIATPMAGVVTALHVTPGQRVAAGEPLAVIEAMKMRYTLSAEADGTITQVLVAEQALVAANQAIVHLAP